MVYRVLVAQQDADVITVFRMNPVSGFLSVELQYPLAGGPAPLAIDPRRRWIVAGLRAQPGLAMIRFDPATVLDASPAVIPLPEDPCYVSVDRSGRYVLSAYYAAGRCAVHRVRADGALDAAALQWVELEPHAHCIQTDPGNVCAYVPQTMPANRIDRFAFDIDSGRLRLQSDSTAPVGPGQGPRHYVYHPTGGWLYTSNEDSSTVSAYARTRVTGELTLLGTWSTLPDDWQGRNTCAQIHIDAQGRWLYVSNRGHDSLAIFEVAASTGTLVPAGYCPTEPKPRAFGIDPTGRFVYVAGLGSDQLAAYRLNRSTGQLEPISTYPLGRNPMWVLPYADAAAG